jgi:hypothetical protein
LVEESKRAVARVLAQDIPAHKEGTLGVPLGEVEKLVDEAKKFRSETNQNYRAYYRKRNLGRVYARLGSLGKLLEVELRKVFSG